MTDRDPLEDFLVRWRRHARRPPATSPPTAMRQLRRRLPARPASRRLPLSLAAALLAVALVVGFTLRSAHRQSPGAPATNPPRTAERLEGEPPLPLDDGVVLLWLDGETPLYLTLSPPPAESRSRTRGYP